MRIDLAQRAQKFLQRKPDPAADAFLKEFPVVYLRIEHIRFDRAGLSKRKWENDRTVISLHNADADATMIDSAVAYCSFDEQFCRAKGRFQAMLNLLNMERPCPFPRAVRGAIWDAYWEKSPKIPAKSLDDLTNNLSHVIKTLKRIVG